MPLIRYNDHDYYARDGETLLQLFLRQGVVVPFSCAAGVCHVCLHRCTEGDIPAAAQQGLRDIYREQRFLLLCRCIPDGDMTLALPDKRERFVRMVVTSCEGDTVTLEPFTQFAAEAKQTVFVYQQVGIEPVVAIVQQNVGRDEAVILQFQPPLLLEAGMEVEVASLVPEQRPVIDMVEGLDRPFPAPDLALWQALDNGVLLTEILKRFYTRVFADEVLGPYFVNVTERRLVEKQYNFLCQAITGEKVYFGERPRNSHHWMVISDAIFERRTAILCEVMQQLQVPDEVAKKLVQIEERYRQDIVKQQPWHKVVFGKILPLDGFEMFRLDVANLCDGCQAEINAGEMVSGHRRTGKIFCKLCREDGAG